MIIGKDTYAASKAILEYDLGKKMTEKEVRMAFGIDYGIPISRIYFIEQPGDFHLDMNMAIVGEKTIVLNDAIAACQTIQPFLHQILNKEFSQSTKEDLIARALARAQVKKGFEDQAQIELEAAGFHVIRFPGKFDLSVPSGPPLPVTNFFNFVMATAPNEERIIIAMGCPSNIGLDLQQLFRNMLKTCAVQYDRLFF